MNSVGSGEAAAAAELADHLVRFSRAFYEAFRVRNNRLRFWRMLFLILEKEKAGKIKDSFSSDEINSILRWNRRTDDLGRWRRQLVKQFADDHGPFLTVVGEEPAPIESGSIHQKKGRPPQTKILELSPHFEFAAKTFVKATATAAQRMSISDADLDRIVEQKGSAIFRKEMGVLSAHYFPAYAKVMDELVLVADNAEKLAEEIKEHPPYWSIILAAWRQHNQNPKKSLNRAEFGTDVHYALRKVEKTEVHDCFSALVGSNILVEDRKSGDGGHLLNEKCMPALGRYAVALKEARKHLASLLNVEFGIKP